MRLLLYIALCISLATTGGIGRRGDVRSNAGNPTTIIWMVDPHVPDGPEAGVFARLAIRTTPEAVAIISGGDLFANAGARTDDSCRMFLKDSLKVGRQREYMQTWGNHCIGLDDYRAAQTGGNEAVAADTADIFRKLRTVVPYIAPDEADLGVYWREWGDIRVIFVRNLTNVPAEACTCNNAVLAPTPSSLIGVAAQYDSFAVPNSRQWKALETAIRSSRKKVTTVVTAQPFQNIQGSVNNGGFAWCQHKAHADQRNTVLKMIQNAPTNGFAANGDTLRTFAVLSGHQHLTAFLVSRNDTAQAVTSTDIQRVLRFWIGPCISTSHVVTGGAQLYDGSRAPDTCASVADSSHLWTQKYYTPGNQLKFYNPMKTAISGGLRPPGWLTMRTETVGTQIIVTTTAYHAPTDSTVAIMYVDRAVR